MGLGVLRVLRPSHCQGRTLGILQDVFFAMGGIPFGGTFAVLDLRAAQKGIIPREDLFFRTIKATFNPGQGFRLILAIQYARL